jgi:hypothetical protein
MKREELHKNIKEKFLFDGFSGTGKTNISLKISKIYVINGKKVLIIDPEHGSDRDIEKLFSDLTDAELGRIELVHATNIETYLKYMLGWTEEKHAGTQTVTFPHGIDYDLKVCDGLTTEIELYKTRLTQKFIKQGYYTIAEKQFPISNPDIFVLPFQFYAKLYDQIKEALVVMLDHHYDVIATMHPLKNTDSQKDLEQSIYQKFDSVIKLNKIILPTGTPRWAADIIKNRGRESPYKSNILGGIEPLLEYFIQKFGMDVEETMKRLE